MRKPAEAGFLLVATVCFYGRIVVPVIAKLNCESTGEFTDFRLAESRLDFTVPEELGWLVRGNGFSYLCRFSSRFEVVGFEVDHSGPYFNV